MQIGLIKSNCTTAKSDSADSAVSKSMMSCKDEGRSCPHPSMMQKPKNFTTIIKTILNLKEMNCNPCKKTCLRCVTRTTEKPVPYAVKTQDIVRWEQPFHNKQSIGDSVLAAGLLRRKYFGFKGQADVLRMRLYSQINNGAHMRFTRRVGVSHRTVMGHSEARWEERGAPSAAGGAKKGVETVRVLFRFGAGSSCRRG